MTFQSREGILPIEYLSISDKITRCGYSLFVCNTQLQFPCIFYIILGFFLMPYALILPLTYPHHGRSQRRAHSASNVISCAYKETQCR